MPTTQSNVTQASLPAVLFLSLLLTPACVKPDPLPVLGHVATFKLTAASGQEFSSKSLEGHAYVADFIFVHCPGRCPRMTSQLRGIEGQVHGLPVQFVSLPVCP